MKRLLKPILFLLAFVATIWGQGEEPSSQHPAQPSSQTATSDLATKENTPALPAASVGDSTLLKPIKTQKAVYPLEAIGQQLQGQVWVKLRISETGDVEDTEVISGDPILAKSAAEAFKHWKFEPYIRNGKAVKVAIKLPMDFAFSGQIKDRPESPTQAEPPRVQVSQGVIQGLKIHDVAPVYPEQARQGRVQGSVLLRAVIGRDGRIVELVPLSGPKQLIPAAVGAVQQWRYKPYVLQGEPIEVNTTIVVNFTLSPHY